MALRREKYIQPVTVSEELPVYEQPKKPTMAELEHLLIERGLKIKLKKILHGGYMSHVYSGDMDGKSIVVKYTGDTFPTDPTSFFIGREIQNTDAKVLTLLRDSEKVRVPRIYAHFPDITTTVMEDLNEEEFELFIGKIRDKSLTVDSALPVGSAMAHLAIESRKWKEFDTDQSAHQNIYDRGLELRMAYPNSQAEYLALENRFTSDVNKRWIWVDGTPKNVLLNPNFQPAFIDFGLSCFADQQHTLPGFLSHLAVYSLSGILDGSMVSTYLGKAVEGYDSVDYLDEEAFCEYFGMEVLHRSMGKRVPGIDKASQKIALLEFGLRVFDDNISTVGALIRLLATSGK